MYKKMLFIGAVAIAGLVTLTAFGGQTREQQQAQINQAIQEQLEAFRIELQDGCTERVMEEAQVRYDAYLAEQAAATAGKPAVKKSTKKSGPSVDPLPQPTKPAATDPQKTRSGAVQEGNVEEQKTRSGAAPAGDVEAQKKRGGAVKKEGGN